MPSPKQTVLRLVLAAIFSGVCACSVGSAWADDAQDVAKLMKSGQLDLAMQKIDSVLAQKPRDAQMRFYKGLILTQENKVNDAISVFVHLTEDYPELPEPYNNLAVLYAAQGDYEKARAALEMAIRTHPSYATAHENLGDVYAKLASQAYDKALQLDATNTAAQTKLSLIRELFSVNTATPKRVGEGSTATLADASGKKPSEKMADKPAEKPVTVAPNPSPAAFAAGVPVVPSNKAAEAKPNDSKPIVLSKAEPVKPVTGATTQPAVGTPAAKPEAAKAEPPKSDDGAEVQAVKSAVLTWAKAWSDKDMSGYFAAYTANYIPSEGGTHAHWQDERRARIEGKTSISVQVDSLAVTIEGEKATVKFHESYKSDRMSASSRKTLVLTKSGGKWLISQERSGA